MFDCDGVVLDSNELKAEMLGRALDGEPPGMAEAFVDYYKQNAGTSRYRLYGHYFRVMRPADDPDAATEAAVKRYAGLLRAGYHEVAEMPGIRDLLARLRECGVARYVNSGSDEEELRDVLAGRGLAAYFTGIFGSPRTKIENLSRIDAVAAGAPVLVLGDARSDMNAAREYGLDFVFVSGRTDWTEGAAHCADNGIPMIATPDDIVGIEPLEAA